MTDKEKAEFIVEVYRILEQNERILADIVEEQIERILLEADF